MRYGIYKAINELIANGSQSSVKAIVVLTDGDYNDWGDPLARGHSPPAGTSPISSTYFSNANYDWYYPFGLPNENMAAYASANNIRIYTIAYGSGLTTDGTETLQLLAAGANGTYFPNADAASLANFYIDIAGALSEVAGVNTTMNLSFQNVVVNNVTVPGNQTFKYQQIAGRSTRVTSWNKTTPSLPGYPKEYDSTIEWNAKQGHRLQYRDHPAEPDLAGDYHPPGPHGGEHQRHRSELEDHHREQPDAPDDPRGVHHGASQHL